MFKSLTSSLTAAAAAGYLLAGCTNLNSHQVPATLNESLPDGAIVYALPAKTYQITATYTLESCGVVPVATASVNVVQSNLADDSQRYYIDYPSQRSHFKDTTFGVELYPNGTLKSFNATFLDQVAPTAIAALNAAVKIAGAATVSRVAGSPCKDIVTKAFATKRKLMDKMVPGDDKAGKLTATESQELGAAVSTLTLQKVLTWTPAPSEPKELVIALGATDLGKWFINEAGSAAVNLQNASRLEAKLILPGNSLNAPVPAPTTTVLKRGLVLRPPVPATLAICRASCPAELDEISPATVIYKSSTFVPQFARSMLFPLDNGLAQSDTLSVSLDEDGNIAKIGVGTANTLATSLTGVGTAADAIGAVVAAEKKAAAESAAAGANAVKNENERIAACLKAQSEIRERGGLPVGECQ